jgi:hypothetical protein
METTTFTALCERAGRWWTIRVPQVDGLAAYQVRSLDQAEIISRQQISRFLGIPPESVRVDVLPDAPAPVVQAIKARHAARQAVEVAGQATLVALDALAHEGYTFQDAAMMLGLSPAEIGRYGPAGVRPEANQPAADVPELPAESGPLQTAGQ